VWIQGEKISGNGELGLRVCIGFVMIMINYKCSWRYPDGMIHSQIDLAFTAVSTVMLFVRPFRAVDCDTDLAWWWLKISGFSFLYNFSFISPLSLTVASCSGNVLPHITPRKHFLPFPFHFFRRCYHY
jgi:hypothetical protein